MSAIPRRVEIEVRVDYATMGMVLSLEATPATTDPFDVGAGGRRREATLYITNAHAAREYAQMLRGAAEALVDYALSKEQPQNFAPAYVPVNGETK